MIHVGKLAPGEQWDQTLIDDLFSDRLYPTGLEFKSRMGYPNEPGCVLVVPGRYWAAHTDQINKTIQRYEWLLLMRVGDEEDLFDISRIEHPNCRFWVQTPRAGRDYGDARLFGVGYTPHFQELPKEPPVRDTNVFLSAQDTHVRRGECFEALKSVKPPKMVQSTEGFTQGMDPDEYRLWMLAAKVAPAPSGAVSPDSFRAWEALEAHTVPVLDDVSPVDGEAGYWRRLFADSWPTPVPVYQDAAMLPAVVDGVLSDWPARANRVTAFWMRYKREMTLWLRADLEALGAL